MNTVNATWDLNISALEGSNSALRSNSHGPLSESRVSRRSEKLKISTQKKRQSTFSVQEKKFL